MKWGIGDPQGVVLSVLMERQTLFNLEVYMIGKYCMVRTNSAGVFAGTVKDRSGEEITLTNARRIWYWDGAASLSQLAMEGTTKPAMCKFPCAVEEVFLRGVIEIIPITDKAAHNIASVPEWKK